MSPMIAVSLFAIVIVVMVLYFGERESKKVKK